MKKYLNFASVNLLVLIMSFNTIACGEKFVSSLESANGYVINASNQKVAGFMANQYADITYWSNKTIESEKYKDIFSENFYNAIKSSSGNLDYFNLITTTSGKVDSDAQKVAPDGSAVNVVNLLLANYEINSTNPKIKDLRVAYKQYNKDFAIQYFQNGRLVKNNTDLKVIEINNKYNPGKTFNIAFSVEIIVTLEGLKNGFVGARKLIKSSPNHKTDISSYYQDPKSHAFLVNVNDKHLVGYNQQDKKIYFTNNHDFDYRFAVNLVFTINF